MATGRPNSTDDQALLDEIREHLDRINLGFDLKVLEILESDKAHPAEIEALKDKLGELVAARLFGIANSTYYGKLRSGKITAFVDVVKHLGTTMARSMAIYIALMSLDDSMRIREIFARSFGAGRLAEILALKLGMKTADRNMVTLGGLFIEIGKIIMLMHVDDQDPEIIEHYHPVVGEMVVECFRLPPALGAIINHSNFTFAGQDDFALSAVIDLAYAVTDRSFRRHGKLVVESLLPDPDGILYSRTSGSQLIEQFQAIGLGAYLEVVPVQMSEQEQRLYEKLKRQLDAS